MVTSDSEEVSGAVGRRGREFYLAESHERGTLWGRLLGQSVAFPVAGVSVLKRSGGKSGVASFEADLWDQTACRSASRQGRFIVSGREEGRAAACALPRIGNSKPNFTYEKIHTVK